MMDNKPSEDYRGYIRQHYTSSTDIEEGWPKTKDLIDCSFLEVGVDGYQLSAVMPLLSMYQDPFSKEAEISNSSSGYPIEERRDIIVYPEKNEFSIVTKKGVKRIPFMNSLNPFQ